MRVEKYNYPAIPEYARSDFNRDGYFIARFWGQTRIFLSAEIGSELGQRRIRGLVRHIIPPSSLRRFKGDLNIHTDCYQLELPSSKYPNHILPWPEDLVSEVMKEYKDKKSTKSS